MDYHSYLGLRFKKSLYYSPTKERKEQVIKFSLFSLLLLLSFSFLPLLLNPLVSNKLKAAINIQKINPGTALSETKETKQLLQNENQATEENLSLILKDEKERTNILLIGIPGQPWPSPDLTDSIEVISIKQNGEILTIAIPRDLLVKIPGLNYETRINALYSIENDPKLLQKALEDITGLQTQYWIVIDLETMEKIVDILGGIDVDVKEDIFDPAFPTVNRGYETFFLKAGPQHLDGKTTIKYIRSRHTQEGDFSRIERQQQVMEVIKNKILNLNFLSDFPKIFGLYNEFQGKTNIGLDEIKTITHLAKNIIDNQNNLNIRYLTFDAGKEDSLLIAGKTNFGGKIASILKPRKGKFDYSEIQERIKQMIN